MNENLLKISNLKTSIDGKEILKGINIEINKGEIHIIMGPNGAGKSTLASVLMGHPRHKADNGKIYFEGTEISSLKTDERARLGMFLSFQYPEEVSGITVENFLRTAKSSIEKEPIRIMKFKKELKEQMDKLNIKDEYAQRYLNVGFSGGEKKKNEILQLLVLKPKLAILDETDSGLDVDAIRTVSNGINIFRNTDNGVLIITHNTKILENLNPDYVHVLVDGKIVKTGDKTLAKEIESSGYNKYQ